MDVDSPFVCRNQPYAQELHYQDPPVGFQLFICQRYSVKYAASREILVERNNGGVKLVWGCLETNSLSIINGHICFNGSLSLHREVITSLGSNAIKGGE